MSHGGLAQKVIIVGVAAAILTAVAALVIGSNYPVSNNNVASTINYDAVAPYIEEYLVDQDIVTPSGDINVPDTNSDANSGTTTIAVEAAINQLLETGKLEYLKGDKGDTGASGQDGVDGTDGQDGQDGTAANLSGTNGIVYSGGVISLKPCAVDQVLSYTGATWDCATVAANSIDTNTTNMVANLTLSGSMLQVAMTDSDGNTISTNQLDLGTHFVTHADLTDYATSAQIEALDARISSIEDSSDTYATKAWTEAQSYLTSSGLASYLSTHDYVTDDALTTVLSSYLLKNEFAATLNTHLLAGDGVSITKDSNGNSVIESLHNAEIFTMIDDHLAITNPETNKIYVDIDESPMKEYIYLNGANGAPTDPSNPAAWSEVGSVTVDLSDYSTTAQTNAAISNALTNQLDDLANHSNLNAILTNYVQTGEMNAAIAAATSDMATKTWVNAQGFLTSSALAGNATEAWVEAQNFATLNDLNAFYTANEVDNLLSSKADQSALDSTNVKVSSLEAAMSSKQDKLTAGQNITINGSVISANIDLSTYATRDYVDQQDFLTNTNALATYATQSYVLGQGFITAAALDGYATENWVDSKGYLTSANLAGYATENWVTGKNYLTTATLASYLTTNGYTTDKDIATLLANYLLQDDFADVLNTNLKAGNGITISEDNTISASMFIMTENRLAITNPDPTGIYVETGTDASSAVAQYIYVGGKNGAPTDPSDPNAWLKVGDLSGVDLSGYSTTEQMHDAIEEAIADEEAALHTIFASQSWVDAQNYLKSDALTDYATKDWTTQNFLPATALSGYATQSWTNSQGFLKQSALASYATQSWVAEQGYITSAALVGNATQAWVQSQKYLTQDAAAANYVTNTALSSTLAAYQPLITGGASTITSANLAAGMLLQSNADGKVAASAVTVSSLSTALTDIATIKQQQTANMAAIAALQSTVSAANSEGSWSEINTGKTYRGKPIYRQDFTLYVNSSANQVTDLQLLGSGVVDRIVSASGWWNIGYGTETWQIPSSSDGANYAYVMLTSGDGRLIFRSKANNGRSGDASNSQAVVIVEYTKK